MAIRGILAEELKNTVQMCRRFESEIRKLPKEVMVVKNIRNRKYLYLARRDGPRIVYRYYGKYDQAVFVKFKKSKQLRRKYMENIKILKAQIKAIRSALRGPATI